MTLKPNILIVEDEAALVAMLRYNLEREGFRVAEASDGEEALLSVAENKPDLILLDWMLPHLSGIDFCRQLRRGAGTRDIPIIIVTARGEESDKIRGLNTGADDYVTKPFSPQELVARVRAVLRRSRPALGDAVLRHGGLSMDLAAHRVRRNGRDVHLGPTEFRLLRHFLEHPGRVFSREQLLDRVWGYGYFGDGRLVDVHVRRLRTKVEKDPANPRHVVTVRGLGYRLQG
jgi:two-component system phosphate regulon response regulator PhoB